ncbi:hypothetical protein F4804DRAFT_323047, partial [Jackrogersella minutella]
MVRVVEFLVQKIGLSVDLQDSTMVSPLFHHISSYTSKYDELYEPGLEDQWLEDLMADFENNAMLERLIQLGAEINYEKNGLLPLTITLESHLFSHTTTLLDAGAKIKPIQPQSGVPYPIHACVKSTRLVNADTRVQSDNTRSILRRLVKAGEDLIHRTQINSTALHQG